MKARRTNEQQRAYDMACVVNARTVGTFAFIAPDARPSISTLLDCASRAARNINS